MEGALPPGRPLAWHTHPGCRLADSLVGHRQQGHTGISKPPKKAGTHGDPQYTEDGDPAVHGGRLRLRVSHGRCPWGPRNKSSGCSRPRGVGTGAGRLVTGSRLKALDKGKLHLARRENGPELQEAGVTPFPSFPNTCLACSGHTGLPGLGPRALRASARGVRAERSGVSLEDAHARLRT